MDPGAAIDLLVFLLMIACICGVPLGTVSIASLVRSPGWGAFWALVSVPLLLVMGIVIWDGMPIGTGHNYTQDVPEVAPFGDFLSSVWMVGVWGAFLIPPVLVYRCKKACLDDTGTPCSAVWLIAILGIIAACAGGRTTLFIVREHLGYEIYADAAQWFGASLGAVGGYHIAKRLQRMARARMKEDHVHHAPEE